MANNQLVAYETSGKFAGTIVIIFPLAFLLTAVLSFCYVKLQSWADFSAPSLIVYTLFLFSLAKLTQWLVRTAKIRNPTLALGSGFILSLTTLVGCWILYGVSIQPVEYSVISFDYVSQLITNSYNVAQDFAVKSYPIIFGMQLPAELIYAIWIVESVGIFLTFCISAYRQSVKDIFCERCQQWTEEQLGLVAFNHSAQQQLMEQFSSGSLEFLDQAKPIFNVPMTDYFRIDGDVCVGCNDFFTLSLNKIIKASDIDRGKRVRLYHRRVVSRAYFQQFQLLSGQFPVPENQ